MSKKSKQSSQKFFFDLHNFDDDQEPEEGLQEEDLPPPPPTFSEAELADAQKTAFENGRQQGYEDAQQSIEKLSQEALERIAAEFSTLFEAENVREQRYEEEAVRLTQAIFKKLYPVYEQTAGLEELSENIRTILAQNKDQKSIVIRVHPDLQAGVADRLQKLSSEIPHKVEADDTLAAGACRLSWEDGGAVRDTSALAEKIAENITQVLAARSADGHDNNDMKEASEAPQKDEGPSSENKAPGSEPENLAEAPQNEPDKGDLA